MRTSISIEADPRLAPLIAQNFELNGLKQPELLNLIAGAEDTDDSFFSLNPNSSLDNRVSYRGWQQVAVPTRALCPILDEYSVEGPVFIKIDTQGYEPQVLAGMEQWLHSRRDWHIKMEFAPNWLESQLQDPLQLLHYLGDHFEFVDFPERLSYNTPNLGALFERPIQRDQLQDFLQYVVSLNRNGLGWVDLLVRPKPL